jgi:hypothetical protein
VDRRGVLDRGCHLNHRLRQNVVDLAQTQVSGPIRYGERREIQHSEGKSLWETPIGNMESEICGNMGTDGTFT